MNFDWARSIQARMEGRTSIICFSLALCGFCLWLFVTHPLLPTPWISLGLILIVLGLAGVIIFHTLLARPRPSEPPPQFLLQQIGNQLVMVGGFNSSDELAKTLREAHNINPLPPAAAVVVGQAKDERYKPLSPAEAQELQHQDETGVRQMLLSEVEGLKAALLRGRVLGATGATGTAGAAGPVGAPIEDTKPPGTKS